MASLSGEPSGRIGYGVASVASSSLSLSSAPDDDVDVDEDEDARAVLVERRDDDDMRDACLWCGVLLANAPCIVVAVVANIANVTVDE